MNDQETPQSDEQSDAVGELLRHAGRRTAPTDEVMRESYAVVEAVWQAERRHRTALRWMSIAAGAALFMVVGMWGWRATTAANVAQLAEAYGDVTYLHAGLRQPLGEVGAQIYEGDEIFSAGASKLLLKRTSGLGLFLGPNTHVKWIGRDRLQLMSGLVYVDTAIDANQKYGAEAGATSDAVGARDNFVIETLVGRIRHLGTQFSVDARGADVRVTVRSGVVSLQTDKGEARIKNGEQASIARTGEVVRHRAGSNDGPWTWLVAAKPQFAIENRALFDVMRDLADVAGVQVVYGSDAMEAQAKQLIMHGPTLTLAPAAALDAVLLTTQLKAEREADIVYIVAN